LSQRFDYASFDRSFLCLYSGDRELIRSSDGRFELSDLSTDWEERRNLSGVEPDRVAALSRLLDDWEARHQRLATTSVSMINKPEAKRRGHPAFVGLFALNASAARAPIGATNRSAVESRPAVTGSGTGRKDRRPGIRRGACRSGARREENPVGGRPRLFRE
jgi:hypothetical protein